MTTAFPYPPRHVVPSSRVPASHIPKPSSNMKRQDPNQRLVGNTRSRLEVLQQQYQQKLLREREAKMIEIYEKNQEAALQRVNRSRQTSLRDFFKERRNLEATRGGAVPSIQQHYKNKLKQQNQSGLKSKQPVWNPARTRKGPELERKPWSGINRGNPLQPIQRQAISADDRYRQPDPDGHYETSDDLTSNNSSNPPSDVEDEDAEFKFVPKPPVQQRPGKVRQTRRTVKQDKKDIKQSSPEDDGYYSNQQEDGGSQAREDDQPPPNFAKAKLLGKIKQKERDRLASREGTFHSDHGERGVSGDLNDEPFEDEERKESKNKRDVLKQQEEELMTLLRQRQQELEKLKRENEEAERQEEERKRKEALRRKKQQEERQRREEEEEERKRLEEEEEQERQEEEEPDSSRDGEDEQDDWYQDREKEEQTFNATYTLKQNQEQVQHKKVKHEEPKKEHRPQIPDKKEAEPNEDLALYIDAADASEEVVLDLTPCPNCGRKFAVERLAKHQKACSSMKKRKVMDPSKMRTQGTELEKYADPRDKRPEPASKKADWRKKREDFIQAIRYAKKVAEVEKSGGRVADLPPPPRSENPDYKQCPHCLRKFNQTAAERHIPKCKDIKARPKPLKRR